MENQFLTNYTETSFLDKIKDNLRHCKAFYFSVSFIKKAGMVLLYKDIEAAIERGVRGRIITSTYQNFTDIESLKSFYALMGKYANFECHLDYECFQDKQYTTLGYHSKGYLFEFEDRYDLIVGSSNITRYALLKNIEWDVLISNTSAGGAYGDACLEFKGLWARTKSLDWEIINQYANKLHYAIERWDMDYDLSVRNVKPNFMQRKALKELNRYRAVGLSKALVVSAAGSGKTYLAAFDAANFNPKRLLYIVHEGSILNKALETFQEVFGSSVTYGVFSGISKEIDSDFIFATNITMSKSLEFFAKGEFDYIIIDECHHATAETYKKIIGYFESEFLLGLTATPERMDNQDVFEMFESNVPYELRLREAIINELVVPFKYYGIRDTLVEYGLSKNEERKMIAQLADENHCDFISMQIEKHRPQGKLKALAFCRNITHARMMCEGLQDQYHTAYLTGKNSIGERIRAYNDLQSDTSDLEILFTVDILNEGVDIPGVNMVLFLRPTESSTIFIQQLGRGLRKYSDKQYVAVLDFIGNSYKRSVQIAFALSSLAENFVVEKRLMVSLVNNNFEALGLTQYGVEVNIDDLSKEEIIRYIQDENFNSLKYLKQDYFNFKSYINAEHAPSHMDYLNNDCAPDILRFINIKMGGRKNYSYYNFLSKIEEQGLPLFSDTQIAFLNYLSEMLPLVRIYEYQIMQCIFKETTNLEDIKKKLRCENKAFQDMQFAHALKFMQEAGYVRCEMNRVVLHVKRDDQFDEWVMDLVTYGLARYEIEYGDGQDFKLWSSYRKDQVQLKLCKNPKLNQKGTYVYDYIVYIFASIKKDASISEHLDYKDKFLQDNLFQWECQAGLTQIEQQQLIQSKKAYLFIRKVESENGMVLPFTFVGTGKLTNPRLTENVKGTLLFDIPMENTLPDYLQFDFGLKID
ncbi:MAG: DUF3427 domain-containing protein [Niameybacter sp.]|uniref:DUF3427 domain-containing protein n=3 Tax=Niameybacter sp. TaxID=2033640 RepID=UPI002FCAA2BF